MSSLLASWRIARLVSPLQNRFFAQEFDRDRTIPRAATGSLADGLVETGVQNAEAQTWK
jgi:hypothetical protein